MSNTNIEIIACGTRVETKIGKHAAIITAASIRFDKIQYECSYFYDGEYRSAWLNENEFSITSEINKINIGFKKYNKEIFI